MVGILPDDSDPMVSVMKVDKAPLESYADIGGLESQVSRRVTTILICDRSMLVSKYIFPFLIFFSLDTDSRNQGGGGTAFDTPGAV